MSSITEQFSVATRTQLETQITLFNTLASSVVNSAEKLIALHLNTGRASVAQSSATAKKLFDAQDPQQLFKLGQNGALNFDPLFDYSRALYSIAANVQSELLETAKTSLTQAAPFAAKTARKAEASAAQAAAKPAAALKLASVSKPAPAAAPAAKPAAAKPLAVAKPAAASKPAVAAKPVVAKPAAAKPVATKPVAAKPVVAKPVVAKPVAAKPVTTQPVAAKPVASAPVAAAPAVAAKPAEDSKPAAVAKPATLAAVASPVPVQAQLLDSDVVAIKEVAPAAKAKAAAPKAKK
jgi:phasin family protein